MSTTQPRNSRAAGLPARRDAHASRRAFVAGSAAFGVAGMAIAVTNAAIPVLSWLVAGRLPDPRWGAVPAPARRGAARPRRPCTESNARGLKAGSPSAHAVTIDADPPEALRWVQDRAQARAGRVSITLRDQAPLAHDQRRRRLDDASRARAVQRPGERGLLHAPGRAPALGRRGHPPASWRRLGSATAAERGLRGRDCGMRPPSQVVGYCPRRPA